MSAIDLRMELELLVTTRRIQKLLSQDPNLRIGKVIKALALTSLHGKRLEWARTHVPNGDQFWVKVLFFDEKRFLLDETDGFLRIGTI